MKTAVIYNSKTGFTKRYAQWIAEASGADCMELAAAKKKNFDAYDAVVFGGWACAGRISGISWLKGSMDKWRQNNQKKLIVFCVGASPAESPGIKTFLRQAKAELKTADVFYCPGGLSYEKMPVPSKLMMKMFVKTLKAKKDKTVEEQEMIRMISSSYDISDKKYVGPILKCLEV